MKDDIISLTSSMDGYVASLQNKRSKTDSSSMHTLIAGDSVHVKTLPGIVVPPFDLQPLIDELKRKPFYESVFVRDFAMA